jgi:hypothetical protein
MATGPNVIKLVMFACYNFCVKLECFFHAYNNLDIYGESKNTNEEQT